MKKNTFLFSFLFSFALVLSASEKFHTKKCFDNQTVLQIARKACSYVTPFNCLCVGLAVIGVMSPGYAFMYAGAIGCLRNPNPYLKKR